MRLLSVEQIYAELRGDNAEVERLAKRRYPPRPPQPPEHAPEPMVRWCLPGQKKYFLIPLQEAAERFREAHEVPVARIDQSLDFAAGQERLEI